MKNKITSLVELLKSKFKNASHNEKQENLRQEDIHTGLLCNDDKKTT